MITFGREVCGDLHIAEKREWLVTNGMGGYASGTVAGTLTRRYHGLLLAALRPPGERTLLVSKLDETVQYGDRDYALYTNRWVGSHEPDGYRNIERFQLEGTTPVWHYALADSLLEKRIWMQPGANITYVRYSLLRATGPVNLTASALVNYRHHHNESRADGWNMHIEPVNHGLKVIAYDGAIPFYLLSDRGRATPSHDWYLRFFLSREADRGLTALDDNLHAGQFEATLQPGESFTFVASVEATANLDGTDAYQERRTYENGLLQQSILDDNKKPAIKHLALAADQFVVQRPLPDDPHGRSIIAGYHWFGDWGRDTMIALPGLTLVTGRPRIAARILRTFAFYVREGMLPNRFPAAGREPEYNTVDAALWYLEAVRAYHAATGDANLVRELFPVLAGIVAHYEQGTRYNIHADPADGLLFAGEAGQQLTWMDAKVGGVVVTPRMGKPVEVNALWYNALYTMVDFCAMSEQDDENYRRLADKVREGFARFWSEELGYCVDVLDTPGGEDDAALRPNQLFAVSLPHSPLTPEQQKSVVDVCARKLLTSYGLRSLAPDQTGYLGSYGGDPWQRDHAYHQGTVWGWLMGAFVRAHLRVYNDPAQARSYLQPMLQQLTDHGVGSISEIFDGDAPFAPRGAIAQAWSVAELLAAWQLSAHAGASTAIKMPPG